MGIRPEGLMPGGRPKKGAHAGHEYDDGFRPRREELYREEGGAEARRGAADPAPPLGPTAGSSELVLEMAPIPSSSVRVMAAPPERQQVASYFAEVDRLEELAAGDPRAFAASMMQSLSSGDFTDFDKLLEKARGQKQRLLAIVPPPSCAEHHRLARTLSADSVAMLERLKAGFAFFQ